MQLEESAFSDAQLLGYEKFWDIINVEKTLYSSAERRGLAKGIEKGLAKGIKKGIEKGLAEGKAEGKAEGLAEAKRFFAINSKKQGIAPEVIASCTGLSLEEIELL